MVLWTAALVLSAAPYALLPFLEGGSGGGYVSFALCPGFSRYLDVSGYLSPLGLIPAPVVILMGFGVWALSAKKGHPRWGRAAGLLTALVVGTYSLVTLSLAAADVVVDGSCAGQWEMLVGGLSVFWHFYIVAVAVLVIAAARVGRPVPRRRDRTSRASIAPSDPAT